MMFSAAGLERRLSRHTKQKRRAPAVPQDHGADWRFEINSSVPEDVVNLTAVRQQLTAARAPRERFSLGQLHRGRRKVALLVPGDRVHLVALVLTVGVTSSTPPTTPWR